MPWIHRCILLSSLSSSLSSVDCRRGRSVNFVDIIREGAADADQGASVPEGTSAREEPSQPFAPNSPPHSVTSPMHKPVSLGDELGVGAGQKALGKN